VLGERRCATKDALESVNGVFVFDSLRATNFLQTTEPDVYVKGGDYTVEDLPTEERTAVSKRGGRILVLGHVPGKSTTNLSKQIMKS
jgi:bifunctional ADP-heptose synthase (sugar kinase/adenylyltransferase)